MRPPKSVKIGGVRYRVRQVNKIVHNGRAYAGEIDYRGTVIRLERAHMARSNAAMGTLLHEVFHGVAEDRGLNIPERQIGQLARGFQEVVVNNGWTLRFGKGA